MNIYEQASEQAMIDNQQQVLDRKVRLDLLKSRERLLIEKLDNLGVKYEKSKDYRFNEEDFMNRKYTFIIYDVYLYLEKVKDGYGQMNYLTEEIELKENGSYKFGREEYSPESDDLDKMIKSITEKVISTTKYYTRKKLRQ
jgi:hypothetical protein